MKYIVSAVLLLLILFGSTVYGLTVSSVTVQVYLGDKPLKDATVELWANNTLKYRGVTDENGTIVFNNISIGNYTIYIYYNGSAWKFIRYIDLNTTVVTLNLTINHGNSTDDNSTLEEIVSMMNNNRHILYTGIAVFFIIILLLAYAFSGRKIPKRR